MLQIQENVSLKNFNTFGIDANAEYFVEINRKEELTELFLDPQWKQTKTLVLGGGSNMLLLNDFDGLVIRINIRGIEHRISQNEVFIEAGAGEVWNDLVNFCVIRGYAGLEQPEPDPRVSGGLTHTKHRRLRRGTERCFPQLQCL